MCHTQYNKTYTQQNLPRIYGIASEASENAFYGEGQAGRFHVLIDLGAGSGGRTGTVG